MFLQVCTSKLILVVSVASSGAGIVKTWGDP